MAAARIVLCLLLTVSQGAFGGQVFATTSTIRSEVPVASSESSNNAEWSVRVDETNGLFVLEYGGRPAVTSSLAFWAENWEWTGVSARVEIETPFRYSLAAQNKALSFTLTSQVVAQPTERRLEWEFDLEAVREQPHVIGGGIVFKFDIEAFAKLMGEPTLLPGGAGWSWGYRDGPRIVLQFEPALPRLYFERGRRNELRAFFYQGVVPKGSRQYRATLSVSRNVALKQSTPERFGLDDPAMWPTDDVDWRRSAVDLSFLNAPEKPAGRRGFVRAVGDSLVFGDGTKARFWGTNLTAYALFSTPKERTLEQAKRLSALGFNLVRLTHHDSRWVRPNLFGDTQTSTTTLDAASLDRIDWWIKCLKDEGIYVWLDLHVGRAFTVADGIDDFEEIRKERETVGAEGYAYVNASMREAMKRFNADYLGHVNRYTGVAYTNEPAIAGVLITNENDLTHHFGNSLLADKGVPEHNAIYRDEATRFARRHDLPVDKVARSWEPGPSKIFLSDLERRFNVEMIEHLRGLGVRVPIATTSTWGGNPLYSLPALSVGDLIDVHAYGGALELEKNPLITENLTHWLASGQLLGKPMAVTEWNVSPFPVPDRHLAPIYVAAQARLQGWDAVMQYAYAQVPLRSAGRPSNWHAFNDPALIATLPAAALLYRRGDVAESRTTYVFAPTAEALYGSAVSPRRSRALRTAAERAKLVVAMPETKELPWLETRAIPEGAIVLRDSDASVIDPDSDFSLSDTGELRRDWNKGIYTIDTPFAQAAMGWLGGREIELSDVEINMTTRNASVIVQSLDNQRISRSCDVLISLAARSVPAAGGLPFRVEPVRGLLRISGAPGLTATTFGLSGTPVETSVEYLSGRYILQTNQGGAVRLRGCDLKRMPTLYRSLASTFRPINRTLPSRSTFSRRSPTNRCCIA